MEMQLRFHHLRLQHRLHRAIYLQYDMCRISSHSGYSYCLGLHILSTLQQCKTATSAQAAAPVSEIIYFYH